MRRTTCTILLLTALTAACGQTPTSAPTSQPVPATPTSAPAATPATAPAASPEALKILDAMEAAGKKHATVRADILYHVNKTLIGDTLERTGYVACQRETAKTPAKFRVHFATLKRGDKNKKASVRVDYAFDGMWLSKTEFNLRQITRYQYAATGQRTNPLRLGEGPFPVPFGQKTSDMLRFFEVKIGKPKRTDPTNSQRLELKTRPSQRLMINYDSLQIWVDSKTSMPVKIRAKDRKSRDIITVTFIKPQAGVKFEDSVFTLPKRRGWEPEIIKPLAQAENIRPN